MNLLILGPQGSGKGTQAELLAEKRGLKHLEMGRILRSVSESENEHAKVVRETIVAGNLVPDEYVRLIAWDFINKNIESCNGFIFEGYPRSVAQYEHVQDMLAKFGKKIDHVILLTISEAETIKRLSARLTCIKCGQVYNSITNPPKIKGICECGGKLQTREDDKPEAIKKRLEIYHLQTMPIIEKARSEGVLIEINGEQSIEKINQEIMHQI